MVCFVLLISFGSAKKCLKINHKLHSRVTKVMTNDQHGKCIWQVTASWTLEVVKFGKILSKKRLLMEEERMPRAFFPFWSHLCFP